MNLSSSFKKIICFLLAVLMLLSAVGCKDDSSSKKKKVVIKKKVIVKTNDNENDNTDNNYNSNNNIQVIIPTEEPEEEKKGLPERPLPQVAASSEKYVETFVPEFDYEYKSLNITDDYVIVYSYEKWNNRKESRNEDGSDRYVNYTGFNRNAAVELQKFFKDNLKLNLEVKRDTDVSTDAKKILVGDTVFYKTSLGETEFAVKVSGDNLIFEGGHFAMVSKAVKWFKTVEAKNGQVAVLNGKQDDFKSQVTLNGVTYDYVWGDEFDGSELMDSNKWRQEPFGLERQDDMVNIYEDEKFQYVENGRLRLSADRYYDEGNGDIGYATSGMVTTQQNMFFRNGYFEFRARLPYRRGAFPAIWTLSSMKDSNLRGIPNLNYDDGYGKYSDRLWIIEFDLFESFADADHMTTTIHKWYQNGVGKTTYGPKTYLTDAQVNQFNQTAIDNGYATYDKVTGNLVDKEMLFENVDVNGVTEKKAYYYPVYINRNDGKQLNLLDYRKRPYTNLTSGNCTYAYWMSYGPDINKEYWGNNKDGLYNWRYYFDEETVNQEYHIYAFQYTSERCKVMIDGNVTLDFAWDPAYDLRDVNGDGYIEDVTLNNNGVGFNLWQYFLIDMMIYTPNNYKISGDKKIVKGDTPYDLYVDWVRCYQDLDDASQAIYCPSAQAD